MEDYAETITAERVRRVIKGYGKVEGTGGNFDYYEVGETLKVDGFLNPKLDVEQIREYVWQIETHSKYAASEVDDCAAFMGVHEGTAYYFHYDQNESTVLNREFIKTMKTKAERYIVYAEACRVGETFLKEMHIEFKQIPNNIF